MASPADFGYSLLPPDPGIISPDLALDAALAPVIDLGPVPDRPLGKGWAFDFSTGQFVAHGTAPAEAYGLDNLRVWIEKTLRTARLAHPIYTDSYGMDEPFFAIGQVDSATLEDEYVTRVTEALLVHDRILAVENFQFSQQPTDDTLYVSFTVSTNANPPQTLAVAAIPLGGVS